MGEGQTKRQIVGSLDMSSSLHQTKETDQKSPLLNISDVKQRAFAPCSHPGFPYPSAVDYYCVCGADFLG